ncbi:hypothetical protein Bcav_3876 [Beutenbergia cavernae DSM 12333]|uniref:IPT/TIG domain-containing protein n=1 Tax=Beutenbergia cavernae (strain ATCC BAA-8 / DSM 12333 / CCUG 43141 / JCM 11478 / NBRC 16432 / NCIMB 13614 / HKI 0122) TaxID=471853 RepID=C5C4J4_BEUC1|nr:hypothetical protein [Beutenbergia cavernae]ACQ82118.1 hypothetical protein Bcav_3876 [Beutenbergia cavernae DSM 12333]
MSAPSPAGLRHRALLAVALAGALLAAGAAFVAGAPPAAAAPRVSVTSEAGAGVASLDGPTTVQVSGSGFQSVQGGFGGVYVFFGWVSDPGGGSWRPSQGGRTGEDLVYVPDSESADNAGYQRFVTFPGSSTAHAANGGELAADGTFALSMVIPGPTFTGQDRAGNASAVDCREVTCGIITVGAHGVVNANNESFTPVEFVAGGASAADEGGDGAAASGGGATADEGERTGDAAAEEGVAPDVPATLGVETTTVVAGRVLTFTGQGFTPGEQVVASLSGGLAAAGPMLAGQAGEVAGVLQLPADIRTGTHTLRLVGAGSGETPEVELTVVADPALAAAAAEAQEDGGLPSWAFLAAAGTGLALLVLVLSSLVTAIVRRRRARRAARGGSGVPDGDGAPGDGPAVPGATGAPGATEASPSPDGARALDDTQDLPPLGRARVEAGAP